ncbi:flavin reductase family protein [Shouchella lehensis]|uniref:Flavin reductase family protein n=1 Tax=Shouchella lehensis TaxID=300825 RepID=A0A4Y7WMR7_9BACI|nr:flavin reductase family protein [Shouchella lehensis]MBG9782863.1 flavin oxidoreductase [Shouchella lehensis]TES49790.1 flavin reductase family protein [Shouchella lehensis]
MLKPVSKASWHTYPSMVAVITSQSNDQVNVMASGWHTFMGTNPGHYGFALRKEAFTYELISQSKTFAVQFLPSEYSQWIQLSGTYSGREQNKFDLFNIPYHLSELCAVPIIKEAYFAYECNVVGEHTYGTHEWIVGEVIQSYRHEQAFTSSNTIDFEQLSIPMYIGRSEYRALTKEAPQMLHQPPNHL